MRLKWSGTLPAAYTAMKGLQDFTDQSKLEPELIELVKIRASQINGCTHCLDMHSKDAFAIGETDQRLHVLAAWREAPFYTPRERAALAWCEALTLLPLIKSLKMFLIRKKLSSSLLRLLPLITGTGWQ